MQDPSTEFKEFWIETQTELIKANAQKNAQREVASLNATIEFAKLAIRGAFILNGGASIAILYNIDKLQNEWMAGLRTSAAGAVCAVVASGLCYLCQRCYLESEYINNAKRIKYNFSRIYDVKIHNETRTQQPDLNNMYLFTARLLAFPCGGLWISSIVFFCSLLLSETEYKHIFFF